MQLLNIMYEIVLYGFVDLLCGKRSLVDLCETSMGLIVLLCLPCVLVPT